MKCVAGCGAEQSAPHAPLDNACWFKLAGMCLGKTRFANHSAAQKWASRNTRTLEAFQCMVCGFSHLGNRGAVVPELTIERRRIVTHLRRTGHAGLLTKLAGEFELADRKEWKRSL